MKSPAFQFYADDFIGGTVALSMADTGAYIRLLCYQWGNGKIPSDEIELVRITGGKFSKAVLDKFPRGKNRRLEQERRKQSEYRNKQRLSGIASGKARRERSLNHRSTVVEPSAVERSLNSPSPSPSPISKEERERVFLAFCFVKEQLSLIFSRNGRPWDDVEERALLELCQRPDVTGELKRIVALRARMTDDDRRFFPHSIPRVIEKWNALLDTDAIYQPKRTPEQQRKLASMMAEWKVKE